MFGSYLKESDTKSNEGTLMVNYKTLNWKNYIYIKKYLKTVFNNTVYAF
jgi:hypothetical protein